MHDLVMRGGTIVDRSGAPRYEGDLAIDGGRIAQVGGKAGAARRTIDAAGALVTPGWVDVHTHYGITTARSPGTRTARLLPGMASPA